MIINNNFKYQASMKSFRPSSSYQRLGDEMWPDEATYRSSSFRRSPRRAASNSGRFCITLTLVAVALITICKLWNIEKNPTVMQDDLIPQTPSAADVEEQLLKFEDSSKLLMVNVLFRHGDSEYNYSKSYSFK